MNFLKKTMILALGFGLLFGGLSAQEYLDNALYVRFKESASVSAKKFQREVVPIESLKLKISQKKMVQNGFHREARTMDLFDNPSLDRTFRIQFDSTVNINKIIRMLENDPNVELVERVPVFKLFSADVKSETTPNDPFYPAVNGVDYLWSLKMIKAEKAWALQKGKPSIKVAVVDGAVWGEHPDLQIPSSLQYNAYQSRTGSSAPMYSGNQDAQCATLYPASSTAPDPCPTYSWSHGTHCAGVVGAINDNEEGISSLASGITLMGVATTNAQNAGSVIAGYEGIRWAANNGARVISCSWGTQENGSDIGQAILKTCYDKNIVIVTAAGNNGNDKHGDPGSSMYVITVGSVDENGVKSSFSNYGNWVDILSPGGVASKENKGLGVISTTYCQNQSVRLYKKLEDLNGKYYDEMSGTSMATPLVSSLCALMLSADSSLTTPQIKDILQNTSTNGNTNSTFFSPLAGIIDAEAAIKAVKEKKFDAPVENLKVTKTLLDTTWISWNKPTNNTHEILGYRVFANGKIVDSCTTETSCKITSLPGGKNIFLVSVVYADGFISTRKEVRGTSPEVVRLTVVATPKEGGSVRGDGYYADGSTATLTAIPNEGYLFVNWKKVGSSTTLSTKPSYTFRVQGKGTYVANFEKEAANEQSESKTFSVVPNPAKDYVKITSPVDVQRIEICDLQGRLVKKIKGANATELSIDTKSLAKGTYVIRLQTKSGMLQQKFVKL